MKFSTKNQTVRKLLLSILIACCLYTELFSQTKLNLSGQWTVALDSLDIGVKEQWENRLFDTQLSLPGTLDDAKLGNPNTLTPELEKLQLTHLTRKHRYVGAAWYAKEIEIPKDWNGEKTILKLERVIWKTTVWVDGVKVDTEQNSLIAPHYFDLSKYLTPGQTHRITLRIDNRKFFDVSYNNLAHAYTDHTQIIWNGVIGEFSLENQRAVHFDDVQVYPDITAKSVKVKAVIQNNTTRTMKLPLHVECSLKAGKGLAGQVDQEITLSAGEQVVEFTLPITEEILPWDEFHPNLYSLHLSLGRKSRSTDTALDFGFRDFKAQGKTFELNGQPIFLRGTLECNIFPLTGHPPMQKDEWLNIFQTAKNWGLNHIRFHSWCPPEAAFAAADQLGVYLQVELPIWSLTVGEFQSTTEFLYEEAQRMIKEYGNHPSFMLWSLGNELQGNMSVLNKMVSDLKETDNRRLFANTSFTFEKGHGDRPEPNDDFFVTQWTKDGWVRGQGVFNAQSPSFNKNYNSALANVHIPVVTHEIGQYAVFPNIREIDKYTGVLDPLNFKAIRNDLQKKGLIQQADDFLQSSGKLAAILYKEEIERALKTAGISGFQLLDLHDFPGQGTALVGLLDAFWESKGILDSTDFKRFNGPLVPLLNFEKATYKNSEVFHADVSVSNYLKPFHESQTIEWSISKNDALLESGKFDVQLGMGFNDGLGKFSVDLSSIQEATKLTVQLQIAGTNYSNSWNIWVYPASETVNFGDVIYTNDVTEAIQQVQAGKKVLLNPDWKTTKGLEGKFVPVFWSPVHFPTQAGTMGLLLDKQNAVFADFPTDNHTDWQWWDLNVNSTTLIIDSLEGGTPLIQMIDNFANNRKLALAFEGSLNEGKLMVVSIDLNSNLEKRIVAKQFLQSILRYMNSDDFRPATIRNPKWLADNLKPQQQEQKKQDATAIY